MNRDRDGDGDGVSETGKRGERAEERKENITKRDFCSEAHVLCDYYISEPRNGIVDSYIWYIGNKQNQSNQT